MSLKTLIKIPLNKKFFSLSLKGPKKRAPLHVPQKWGPMEADTHFHCLTYLLRSPVKELSLHASFMESLRERCPVSTVLLHSYFEVPGI
jgi:hypothetical protein